MLDSKAGKFGNLENINMGRTAQVNKWNKPLYTQKDAHNNITGEDTIWKRKLIIALQRSMEHNFIYYIDTNLVPENDYTDQAQKGNWGNELNKEEAFRNRGCQLGRLCLQVTTLIKLFKHWGHFIPHMSRLQVGGLWFRAGSVRWPRARFFLIFPCLILSKMSFHH